MAIIKKTLFTGALLMPAVCAQAHIYWDSNGNVPPRNLSGVSCGTRGDSPAVFKSGARITVTYNVAVKHGDTVRVEFSPENSAGFEQHVLLETPAVAGFNDVAITLPDIECNDCTLRVWESGYQSCADIQLTASGLHEGDEADTQPPAEVLNFSAQVADKNIALSWENPTEDFYKVIILQSDTEVMSAPNNGASYNAGDQWGNAIVVYSGKASDVVIPELMRNTHYHYKIFTADTSLNYSAGTALQATTTDLGNSQPEATLTVMQNNVITAQTLTGAGNVYVQAAIHDFDSDDFHTLDWSATDYRLMDINSDDAMFEFDPSQLMPGDYAVTLTVTDNGTPPFSDTQTIMVNVRPSEVGASSEGAALVPADNATGGSVSFLSLIFMALLSLGCGIKGLIGINKEHL